MDEKQINEALIGDFRPGRDVPSPEFRAGLPDPLRAMLEKREAAAAKVAKGLRRRA